MEAKWIIFEVRESRFVKLSRGILHIYDNESRNKKHHEIALQDMTLLTSAEDKSIDENCIHIRSIKQSNFSNDTDMDSDENGPVILHLNDSKELMAWIHSIRLHMLYAKNKHYDVMHHIRQVIIKGRKQRRKENITE